MINRCTVNLNVFLQTAIRYTMGVEVYPYCVITLVLDTLGGQCHVPAALPSGRAPETIRRGDEREYFCPVSILQIENRRISLY
jgi:hypothetical protein